ATDPALLFVGCRQRFCARFRGLSIFRSDFCRRPCANRSRWPICSPGQRIRWRIRHAFLERCERKLFKRYRKRFKAKPRGVSLSILSLHLHLCSNTRPNEHLLNRCQAVWNGSTTWTSATELMIVRCWKKSLKVKCSI